MSPYTLICEYAGETYIAQLNATSPKNAIMAWLGARGSRKCMPKEARLRFKENLDNDPLWPSLGAEMFGATAHLPGEDSY